ncbi:holo-ACP synthase [Pelosinus propionicus]|uniref:holo-ACP synthase n=1 Tax=Pelosinus propionicus TaxID=380084 RepID=UPI000B85E484|nr:holo-ACP synthase [Pelosinus propionicus]
MIIGTGIDIIEISRIKDAIVRQSFVDKVFTLQEQQYCESRGVQKSSSYAARFAGKEAVMKAFGTGMAGGRLKDIEIILDDKGCPHVKLSGQFGALAESMGVSMTYISLTHAREYAAAQVILWGGK